MKICIDGVVREMTAEEEAKYYPPKETEELDDSEALSILTGESA